MRKVGEVWAPVLAAGLAALVGWLGLRQRTRQSSTEARNREQELAVTGLAQLITELQEERAECRRQLEDAWREVRALRMQMFEEKKRNGG